MPMYIPQGRREGTYEIVLDNESGPLGRHDELLDNFTSVDTLFGIEVCGGFINEQNICWDTEYETDGNSLQLSSGQSGDQLAIVAQSQWAYVWTSWSIMGSICIGLMTSELNWGSVYQHGPGPTGRQRTHEHGLDPLEQEMPDGTWEFGGD
jgi:hypothetical protein